MPVITFDYALKVGLAISAAFGGGSLLTALVSARRNKGDYFLQGFKQIIDAQQAATAQATSAANTCADKLAQRDATIAQRDQTIREMRDAHDGDEADWKARLRAAEEDCHGYKLRLIDAGLLAADATRPRPQEATP